MRNLNTLLFLFIAAAFLTCGCSSRVVHAPIDPYADPEVGRFTLNRVAVFPFVIPDYLQMESGAETISIDMTNQFIAGTTSRRLMNVMDGRQIQTELRQTYASPRDWIFQGTLPEAIDLARAAGADGVVFGKVRKYLQGNLSDSEVEVEITLVEVSTMSTVWSVRELVIGKGGGRVVGPSTDTVVSARTCSLEAVQSVLDKVEKIYAKGGPIKVSTVSPKKIGGYSAISAGVISFGVSGYFMSESLKSYQNYENASSDYDLARYREKTQQSDLMWQIWGAAGLAALGAGIYLLVTDYQKIATAPPRNDRRFVLAPTVSPKGKGAGVVCLFRF